MQKIVTYIAAMLLLTGTCFIPAKAQLHPVQINLTCPPTLPGTISGLYRDNGLKATITLLDSYQLSLEVGISFTIRGNGAVIERRADYRSEDITLQYAVPQLLGERFFGPLLQEGITYSGPNRDAFERQGVLTGGRYEVTLWAYDLNRPATRISNLARVYIWVQRSAPPALILPQNGAVVYAIPQVFTWSASPHPAGLQPIRYRFRLFELQDPNRQPEDEVAGAVPFYEEEVMTPSFTYLPLHPLLIRGKRYAWQVQAVSLDMQQQEVAIFNNEGYTAVRSFSYGTDATSLLKKPLIVEAKSGSPYSLDVTADFGTDGSGETPDGFRLEYRAEGETSWSEAEVDDDYLTLKRLTPATTYELRGYARLGAMYGEAGAVVRAATQPVPEVKCGETAPYKPDATTKLEVLAAGDIVMANRIPFTVGEVKEEGGYYSGKAYSAIPVFGGRRLAFKLERARFNATYELIEGAIKADTIGIQRYIQSKLAEKREENAQKAVDKGNILNDPDTKKVEGDIADEKAIVVDKEAQTVTVKTTDGKEQVIRTEGKPITLVDSQNEVYRVEPDGTVSKIGMYDGAASGTGSLAANTSVKPQKLHGAGLLVEFVKDDSQRYGFDNPRGMGTTYWSTKYDSVTLNGQKEPVAAKMVAAGAGDPVQVILRGDAAEVPADSLMFITTTGMRYQPTPTGKENRLKLNLIGGAPDSRQELTAWLRRGDTALAVGRLSVDVYSPKRMRLVVVPVGDASPAEADKLAKALNDAYMQAGVGWDVTVSSQRLLMPEGVGESIKVDKSLLSAYSPGMRRIRNAFMKTSTYRSLGDKDIYILFLTTLPMQGEDDGSEFDGYMPYGKQFGFISSTNLSVEKLAWAAAHELGHGAFSLQHVWLEPGYSRETANLMGYTTSSELFRWQWEQIHHPQYRSNYLAEVEDLGAKGAAVLTPELLRNLCYSFNSKEYVTATDRYVVPDKGLRYNLISEDGTNEYAYFYDDKSVAEKYLSDNNLLNNRTYALASFEGKIGVLDKLNSAIELAESAKGCPAVYNAKNKQDFALEVIRAVKLAKVRGKKLAHRFGSTVDLAAGEVTLPNRKVLGDVKIRIRSADALEVDVSQVEESKEVTELLGKNDTFLYFGKAAKDGSYLLEIGCNTEDMDKLKEYLNVKVVKPTRQFEAVVLEDLSHILQEKGQCKVACDKIVGYSTSRATTRDIYTRGREGEEPYLIAADAFDMGVDEIVASLKGGDGVVAGVYRLYEKERAAPSVNNPATHHFVAIYGMGSENGRSYFLYFDVGTNNDDFKKNNKLFVDLANRRIEGDINYQLKNSNLDKLNIPISERKYLLTEVRVKNTYKSK